MSWNDEVIKQFASVEIKLYYYPDNIFLNRIDLSKYIDSIDDIVFDQEAIILGNVTACVANNPTISFLLDKANINKKCEVGLVVNEEYKTLFLGKLWDVSIDSDNLISITLKNEMQSVFETVIGNKGTTVISTKLTKTTVTNVEKWCDYNTIFPIQKTGLTGKHNPADIAYVLLTEFGKLADDSIDLASLASWKTLTSQYNIGIECDGQTIKEVLNKLAVLTNSFIFVGADNKFHFCSFLSEEDVNIPVFVFNKKNIFDISVAYETENLCNNLMVVGAKQRSVTEGEKEDDLPKDDYLFLMNSPYINEKSIKIYGLNETNKQDDFIWHINMNSANEFGELFSTYFAEPVRKVTIKTGLFGALRSVGEVVEVDMPLYGIVRNIFRINKIAFSLEEGCTSIECAEINTGIPVWRWDYFYDAIDYPCRPDPTNNNISWGINTGLSNYDLMKTYSDFEEECNRSINLITNGCTQARNWDWIDLGDDFDNIVNTPSIWKCNYEKKASDDYIECFSKTTFNVMGKREGHLHVLNKERCMFASIFYNQDRNGIISSPDSYFWHKDLGAGATSPEIVFGEGQNEIKYMKRTEDAYYKIVCPHNNQPGDTGPPTEYDFTVDWDTQTNKTRIRTLNMYDRGHMQSVIIQGHVWPAYAVSQTKLLSDGFWCEPSLAKITKEEKTNFLRLNTVPAYKLKLSGLVWGQGGSIEMKIRNPNGYLAPTAKLPFFIAFCEGMNGVKLNLFGDVFPSSHDWIRINATIDKNQQIKIYVDNILRTDLNPVLIKGKENYIMFGFDIENADITMYAWVDVDYIAYKQGEVWSPA